MFRTALRVSLFASQTKDTLGLLAPGSSRTGHMGMSHRHCRSTVLPLPRLHTCQDGPGLDSGSCLWGGLLGALGQWCPLPEPCPASLGPCGKHCHGQYVAVERLNTQAWALGRPGVISQLLPLHTDLGFVSGPNSQPQFYYLQNRIIMPTSELDGKDYTKCNNS